MYICYITFTSKHKIIYYSAVPDGPPINVTSSDVTSNSLTLTWNPPPIAQRNGNIRYYIISVLELNTGNNFTFRTHSHATLLITDLHPFYDYAINVVAVTVGTGPPSTVHRVTTLEDGKKKWMMC